MSIIQNDLTSPAQTTATIGIPKQYFDIKNIRLNEKNIWTQGKVQTEITGIKFIGEDNKYLKFEVAPGQWRISAK